MSYSRASHALSEPESRLEECRQVHEPFHSSASTPCPILLPLLSTPRLLGLALSPHCRRSLPIRLLLLLFHLLPAPPKPRRRQRERWKRARVFVALHLRNQALAAMRSPRARKERQPLVTATRGTPALGGGRAVAFTVLLPQHHGCQWCHWRTWWHGPPASRAGTCNGGRAAGRPGSRGRQHVHQRWLGQQECTCSVAPALTTATTRYCRDCAAGRCAGIVSAYFNLACTQAGAAIRSRRGCNNGQFPRGGGFGKAAVSDVVTEVVVVVRGIGGRWSVRGATREQGRACKRRRREFARGVTGRSCRWLGDRMRPFSQCFRRWLQQQQRTRLAEFVFSCRREWRHN